MTDLFFELLQVALGKGERLSHKPSADEWWLLYQESLKQSVGGFAFTALELLSKSGQKPPTSLLYEWIGYSEQVKQQNVLINNEAARLTKLFEQEGHNTAILKGQANARLYKQPWCRQPGDIDIWVNGGKCKVEQTTRKLKLLEGNISNFASEQDTNIAYHHFHLSKKENGIEVEVHFRPSSGNMNPFTNKRLQLFLEKEIKAGCSLVDEGFKVPCMRFALVMQLAHIQRHLISEGVGMRQVIDYFYLLRNDDENQRDNVSYQLRSFGLNHIAGALMWILHEKLGLEEKYLISPLDEKRGRMMLRTIMEGGNFGHYKQKGDTLLGRTGAKHSRQLQMMKFDTVEALWTEIDSIFFFFKTIPERIRLRKWSLE